MNLKRPWTEVEEANLIKWLSEGVSLFAISARLKRSVMAVQTRAYQLQKQQKPTSASGKLDLPGA
jgi:hypothetical protein